jgi:8-hydroxy-5-deazaflavin:NADPH oxidoreductase
VLLAFIGGTGPEGIGLAVRMAMAGHEIIVGSRSPERASEAAQRVKEFSNASVSGMLNEDAAQKADMVFNTVPFSAQADLLPGLSEAIGSKTVVSTVVPLQFVDGTPAAAAVAEGSAAEQAQALLPAATVVGAFQTLSAVNLTATDHPVEADVLVTADDKEAKQAVMDLARQIEGVRPVDAGRLANSQYVEHITALLLNINKRYKKRGCEFRIVGLGEEA